MLMSDRWNFDEFFRTTTNFAPFPWQQRLAEDLVANRWPTAIQLPTGTGKSSIVAIWLYALAHTLAHSTTPRSVPMRLIYVVNRRLIVDTVESEAQALARQLSEALRDADHPLAPFAEVLTHVSGGAPLIVQRARSGVRVPWLWTPHPAQPALFVSTVDQAGSRLLFRGYNVSRKQRALQAGIFGVDSLWLVDEAHLSTAFVETLLGIAQAQTTASSNPLPVPRIIPMSATLPSSSDSHSFALSTDDWRHPELHFRLSLPKWVELHDFKDIKAKTATESNTATKSDATAESQKTQSFAVSVAALANDITVTHGGGVGAIIVNRVDTARKIATRLDTARRAAERKDASTAAPWGPIVLLTSRMRAIDRQALLSEWLPRVRSQNPTWQESDGMAWVVATQTVEVGADWDFDVVISECAPLPSLIQRFGRLNRLGQRSRTRGLIVPHDDVKGIYHVDTVVATWEWLNQHADMFHNIDFSSVALRSLLDSDDGRHRLVEPPLQAPVLLDPHVAAWSQTVLEPSHEPSIVPFLHGKSRRVEDVHIIWRNDVLQPVLELATQDEETERVLAQYLQRVPPQSGETLDMPVWHVRPWLHTERPLGLPLLTDAVSDAADLSVPEDDKFTDEHARPVWRVNGMTSRVISPRDIRPGDTLIVPTSYGGLDRWGWNPKESHDACDRFEECLSYHQTLRLHTTWLRQQNSSLDWDVTPIVEVVNDVALSSREQRQKLAQWIEHTLKPQVTGHAAALCNRALAHVQDWTWQSVPTHLGFDGVLVQWVEEDLDRGVAVVNTDDADQHQGLGDHPIQALPTLHAHLQQTQHTVRRYAERLGLPAAVTVVVMAAAEWHDLGKLDRRFQCFLHAGDWMATAADPEPRAKSGLDPRDQATFRLARAASQLPKGFRHEELSVHLLQGLRHSDPFHAWPDDQWALFLHLVGSHHGWGRPWFPMTTSMDSQFLPLVYAGIPLALPENPILGSLTSGWVDQFEMLQQRWGAWGLAFLESLVRLADYEASVMGRNVNVRDST